MLVFLREYFLDARRTRPGTEEPALSCDTVQKKENKQTNKSFFSFQGRT